jgi:hypothetical protein
MYFCATSLIFLIMARTNVKTTIRTKPKATTVPKKKGISTGGTELQKNVK